MPSTNEERLRQLYDAFNARDIDAVSAALHPDVDWPNGWEGGRLAGADAVRDYWRRQFDQIIPSVEPRRIELDARGRLVVDVHQVVLSVSGELLSSGPVRHVYRFRDDLVERMDIEEAPGHLPEGATPV